MNNKKINIKKLKKTILDSTNFSEVGRKLNICRKKIKSIATKYSLDYKHFEKRRDTSYVGMSKNMLTIASVEKINKRNFALCLCKCGKYKKMRLDSILSGKIISCGCHIKNKIHSIDRINSINLNNKIKSKHINKIKYDSKKRNIYFNLNKKYLWDLFINQDKKCALSGLDIIFDTNLISTTASLDRIDSNKGYIKDNVQWVYKDINLMKNNIKNERFIELCKFVSVFTESIKDEICR